MLDFNSAEPQLPILNKPVHIEPEPGARLAASAPFNRLSVLRHRCSLSWG